MRSRKDIQTQEGLVSLLGAERMRSHFVVAVAMVPALLRAGTRSLRNSVHEVKVGRTRCCLRLGVWDCEFRCALSDVMERFRQFCYAKHVYYAFKVVCHRRKTDSMRLLLRP